MTYRFAKVFIYGICILDAERELFILAITHRQKEKEASYIRFIEFYKGYYKVYVNGIEIDVSTEGDNGGATELTKFIPNATLLRCIFHLMENVSHYKFDLAKRQV